MTFKYDYVIIQTIFIGGEKIIMAQNENKRVYLFFAKLGDINVALPIKYCEEYGNNRERYFLIDGTSIYGHYSSGSFVITTFDSNSEIMKNVLKCMSLVTCYDGSKQMDALDPSEDDNMQVGRILKPISSIKMWSK